jgi:hypothetical protein
MYLSGKRSGLYESLISSKKTPGTAGGLTEFDSSGNMFLKLASTVQIGCPRHDKYLPRRHQELEKVQN